MSIKFLVSLADRALPYATSLHDEIVKIEVLVSAKLIFADVPLAIWGSYEGEAVVHAIRQAGKDLVASTLLAGRTE